MTKIFVINAGQKYGHSGGKFNKTLMEESYSFFDALPDFEVQKTDINDEYNTTEEVAKFVWADVIIYHTPIWWFQLPFEFKKYIDVVFTAGHDVGIYHNDGRSSANPKFNYGRGGMMHDTKYLVTTSWNAPEEAFTMPGEFFNLTSVDDGVLFGFHRMNAFAGMSPLESLHFHDVEKDADVPRDMAKYKAHLTNLFLNK